MQEEWRPVVGYEDWYEVSSEGRIKVLPYDVVTTRNNKPCVLHRTEKILDPKVAASVGCRIITLTNRISGESTFVRICDLVAEIFNGLQPGSYERSNDDVTDDRASNLVSKFSEFDTADRIWKSIPGYEGLYEISNLGEVKSLGRIANHKSHRRIRKPAKMLKFSVDEDGYFDVGLHDANGVLKQFRVNRLVAMVFIPNPDNLPVVNHKNGNKQDNRVDNLEWCTVKHNTFEAYRMGLNNGSLPIPVICLDNNMYFESVMAAASWVGCDHGNIIVSMNNRSCCKYGWCFVRQSDYPDDPISYLAKAKQLYYSKPGRYRGSIKCLDTGEIFSSVKQCASRFGRTGDSLSESMRRHRLFEGCCYVRIEDLKFNNWDELDYCKWVHEFTAAIYSHDDAQKAILKEYGKHQFNLQEKELN